MMNGQPELVEESKTYAIDEIWVTIDDQPSLLEQDEIMSPQVIETELLETNEQLLSMQDMNIQK